MSPCWISRKKSTSRPVVLVSRGWVVGVKGSSFRSGRSMPKSCHISARPSGVSRKHRRLVELETREQHLEHVLRDAGSDLETYRLGGSLPIAKHRFHCFEQVVGFNLLDGEVGASGDPKLVVVDDVLPAEEPIEVPPDELLQGNQAASVGEGDEARDVLGDLHPGELQASVVIRAAQEHREVQRKVRDERERVGRVHGQRCQNREDFLLEHRIQMLAVREIDRRVIDEPNSLAVEVG